MTYHNEPTRSDDRLSGDTSSGDSPSRGRIRYRNPPPDDPSPPRRQRRRGRSASTDGDVGERPSQARQAAETGTPIGTGENTDNGTGANTETGSGTGGGAAQRATPKPGREQSTKPTAIVNTPVDDRAYEVGYGKPPQHTRFRKGKSGNPKGRPKGRKNFKTEFNEEFSEPVAITENGKKIRISKQRALIKKLFILAADGNIKALDTIHKMIDRYLEPQEASAPTEQPLSAEDQAILDQMLGKTGRYTTQPQENGDE